MLKTGPAKKVVIYINEDTRCHHEPLWSAVMSFLHHKKVAGATATKAMKGFGVHHAMHTVDFEAAAEHLPVRIEFIEAPGRVEELLPELSNMVTDGLIEIQDTSVFRAANAEEPEPLAPARERFHGPARLIRVYVGEADRWEGIPLYEAIINKLRGMEMAGATVYRGLMGYGVKGHTHRDRLLRISADAPVMITVVDQPESIERAIRAIEPMLGDGLIVISEVEMIRVVRGPGASV